VIRGEWARAIKAALLLAKRAEKRDVVDEPRDVRRKSANGIGLCMDGKQVAARLVADEMGASLSCILFTQEEGNLMVCNER